jgi:UrcA family protein
MRPFHIIVSLLTLTPVTAFAQQVPTSVGVSYGDLDLSSEAGVKTLDRRLATAIRSVCGAYDGSVIPERRFAVQRCLTEKRAEVAALRDRAVTRYSSSKTLVSR